MAAMELKIGDHVQYGTHGVCRVCGEESRAVGGQDRMYFTLRPTGKENILLYLPKDAEPEKVHLRHLLSRQELMALIDASCQVPAEWIADSKRRRETFSRAIREGDSAELIRMLKCIHLHMADLPQGKLLPMSDQEMMSSAKRQLYSEMAYVLDLEEDQVQDFILERVSGWRA